MNKYIATILGVITFLTVTSTANAQYGCPPYGAECPPASKLVVDKTIRDPRGKGDVYVDNLTASDYKFGPGEDVIFRITIKNTGDKAIDNVEGIDTLPLLNDLLLTSGDARDTMRELTKSFGTINPGETKTWFLRTRVKAADQVPSGTVCGDPKAINRVIVRAKDMPDTGDTSSFCIQKSVLGATKQPEAGSELYIIAGGLVALFGVGFTGNKFSNLFVK